MNTTTQNTINILAFNDLTLSDSYEGAIYTKKTQYLVNEPITFSVFIKDTDINALTVESALRYGVTGLHVNFNDTFNLPVCSYYNTDTFTYSYKNPQLPAIIQITAVSPNSAFYFSLNNLDIYQELPLAASVSRVNLSVTPELPHKELTIPINDFHTKEVFNYNIQQINENINYIKNLCSYYKSSPYKFIGWGDIQEIIHDNLCTEMVPANASNISSANIYGIVEGFNKAIPLLKYNGDDLISYKGTSIVNAVSTITLTSPDVSALSSYYITNLEDTIVPLFTSTAISNLQTLNLSSLKYTHTVYNLDNKNISINSNNNDITTITVVTGDFLVVNSCDEYKLIPLYDLSGIEIVQDYVYDTQKINWHFVDQFNYDPSLNSDGSVSDINDIVTVKDSMYLSRRTSVEKYNLIAPYIETAFSTNTIDIEDPIALYSSVAVTPDEERIFTIDIKRVQVKGFTKNPITKKFDQTIEWGELGGNTARYGLYKPSQLIINGDYLYIVDAGNRCVKKYTFYGSWVITYFIPNNINQSPLNICFDKSNKIHVLFPNYILTITEAGVLEKSTIINLESTPVKITTNTNKDILYVCCKKQVYRFTLNHVIIDSFAEIDNSFNPIVNDYISITCNDSNEFFITDGQIILRYSDNIQAISSRTTLADIKMWTTQQLQINDEEFVTDWVYNKSFRRLGENLEILYRSIHSKIIVNKDKKAFELAFINEKDVGYFSGLPNSIDDLAYLGINEIVTAEAMNRVFSRIQENIQYIFDVVLNKITLNKTGHVNNFQLKPIILEKVCWNWDSRKDGFSCTPWYWLNDTVTWIHAKNPNDAVKLNGAKFEIQDNFTLNSLKNNFTISFWMSANFVSPLTQSCHILGFETTASDDHGFKIELNTDNTIQLTIKTLDGEAQISTIYNYDINELNHYCVNVYYNEPGSGYIDFGTNGIWFVNGVLNSLSAGLNISNLALEDIETSPLTFNFGSTGLPLDTIIHDIRIIDITPFPLEVGTSIQTIASHLATKPQAADVLQSIKNNTIAHWYGNDTKIWLDTTGENHATHASGDPIELLNYFGQCCD